MSDLNEAIKMNDEDQAKFNKIKENFNRIKRTSDNILKFAKGISIGVCAGFIFFNIIVKFYPLDVAVGSFAIPLYIWFMYLILNYMFKTQALAKTREALQDYFDKRYLISNERKSGFEQYKVGTVDRIDGKSYMLFKAYDKANKQECYVYIKTDEVGKTVFSVDPEKTKCFSNMMTIDMDGKPSHLFENINLKSFFPEDNENIKEYVISLVPCSQTNHFVPCNNAKLSNLFKYTTNENKDYVELMYFASEDDFNANKKTLMRVNLLPLLNVSTRTTENEDSYINNKTALTRKDYFKASVRKERYQELFKSFRAIVISSWFVSSMVLISYIITSDSMQNILKSWGLDGDSICVIVFFALFLFVTHIKWIARNFIKHQRFYSYLSQPLTINCINKNTNKNEGFMLNVRKVFFLIGCTVTLVVIVLHQILSNSIIPTSHMPYPIKFWYSFVFSAVVTFFITKVIETICSLFSKQKTD